jgi:exonuclease SbcD
VLKIAHIGDIHWGLGYPGPSPDSRFKDICRVMDWVADRIINERCDLVLVAGDFFKDANVFLNRASVEIAACVAWLRKLSEVGIEVIAISGTPSHDAIAAYELLKEMRIPGVAIYTSPGVYNVGWRGPRGISIACLPGLNRSTIASKEEYSKLAPHEIHQLMTGKITQLVMGMAAQCQYSPRILLSHITCAGADKGFEDLLQQQEPILTKEAIEGSGFDLVCLGHIHKMQKVEGLTVPTFYCGSPERLSFNEENVIPGFWIHEFEESDYQASRFIATPARKFITVEHDLRDEAIADLDSWYQELANIYTVDGKEEALLLPDETGAIIRLKYKATAEVAKAINKGEIIKNLQMNSPFYIAEIKADIEKSNRTRAVGASAEMGPIEGLKMWMEMAQISEKDRDELVARTEDLLREVETRA